MRILGVKWQKYVKLNKRNNKHIVYTIYDRLPDTLFVSNLKGDNEFHYLNIKNVFPMYILLVNPDTFEVHEITTGESGFQDFNVLFQKKPSGDHKDVFGIYELNTVEGLNFEQIMDMLYSEDDETKTLVEDIIQTYQVKE